MIKNEKFWESRENCLLGQGWLMKTCGGSGLVVLWFILWNRFMIHLVEFGFLIERGRYGILGMSGNEVFDLFMSLKVVWNSQSPINFCS